MIKQVIIWRKDLICRKGKLMSQASHAAMKVFMDRAEFFSEFSSSDPEVKHYLKIPLWPEAREWLSGNFTKIVLYCSDLNELNDLKEKADSAGIPNALVVDSGATEFHGVPTTTCLAIGPDEDTEIDKITGHLKLL